MDWSKAVVQKVRMLLEHLFARCAVCHLCRGGAAAAADPADASGGNAGRTAKPATGGFDQSAPVLPGDCHAARRRGAEPVASVLSAAGLAAGVGQRIRA